MNITFDVPFILTMLVLASGIISLIDVIFLAKKRAKDSKQPIIIEYARSFFPVLLLVWVIRSFIIQPYRVPTGSLEPTILPGDFIVVNQFAYGLRLPVLNKKIVDLGEPKTGDIVLFHHPLKPSMILVKRVIGLPGDHVVYDNKTLTINGKQMPQKIETSMLDLESDYAIPVEEIKEKLPDGAHEMFVRPGYKEGEKIDVVVPANHYFMMGDNRDNSDDSRYWGFVPEENLIGKAFGIWLSWDSEKNNVRWDRFGKAIK